MNQCVSEGEKATCNEHFCYLRSSEVIFITRCFVILLVNTVCCPVSSVPSSSSSPPWHWLQPMKEPAFLISLFNLLGSLAEMLPPQQTGLREKEGTVHDRLREDLQYISAHIFSGSWRPTCTHLECQWSHPITLCPGCTGPWSIPPLP